MLSVACYGRLLVVGALSPTEDVRAARSELPRWAVRPAHPQRSLSAAAAASAESAAGTSDATAAARACQKEVAWIAGGSGGCSDDHRHGDECDLNYRPGCRPRQRGYSRVLVR